MSQITGSSSKMARKRGGETPRNESHSVIFLFVNEKSKSELDNKKSVEICINSATKRKPKLVTTCVIFTSYIDQKESIMI